MKQILIVDDNISILKQISAHLAGTYEVSLAKSGELALQICVKTKPDLILLDVEMPGMDGFQVLSSLQNNFNTERIPVIFLTASRNAETEAKALSMGARDFIIKPAEKSILLNRINLHLRFSSYQLKAEAAGQALSDCLALVFSQFIVSRDMDPAGHVARTAKYVEFLGQTLIEQGLFQDELSLSELAIIIQASPLHDIGKIAISDRILMKAGRLDDEEFTIMKRHAAIGAEILEHMYRRNPTQHFLHYAKLIAGSHHERWDGKGYPIGLAGNEIPLCGRLVAIADVYDALINNQIYRTGIGHTEACNIITGGKGTQFDPQIVEVFKTIKDSLQDRIKGAFHG
jgi:putative two-component system response regulator